MTNLICIFLLIAPSVAYKIIKDWNGYDHKGSSEFLMTSMVMAVSAFVTLPFAFGHEVYGNILIDLAKCFAVSITGFGLFFNYLFNLFWSYKIFKRNYFKNRSRLIYIFDNLNEDVIPDKWIKGIHWGIRLIAYIMFFVLAIIWFVS